MWTVRRTVTMPAQLAVAIDAAVAGGAADSISALLATAARRYLDQLTDDRIATHAARLDPDTELALISRARAGVAPAGWERLTCEATSDRRRPRTQRWSAGSSSPPTPSPPRPP